MINVLKEEKDRISCIICRLYEFIFVKFIIIKLLEFNFSKKVYYNKNIEKFIVILCFSNNWLVYKFFIKI